MKKTLLTISLALIAATAAASTGAFAMESGDSLYTANLKKFDDGSVKLTKIRALEGGSAGRAYKIVDEATCSGALANQICKGFGFAKSGGYWTRKASLGEKINKPDVVTLNCLNDNSAQVSGHTEFKAAGKDPYILDQISCR